MSNDDNRTQTALTNPAQLQATLSVIPAHTWYAASSGGLTFVNQATQGICNPTFSSEMFRLGAASGKFHETVGEH